MFSFAVLLKISFPTNPKVCIMFMPEPHDTITKSSTYGLPPVASAMIMPIAHGANDVSNAIGPFTTEYETWISGVASATADTPDWIKAVRGLGLGLGFWTYGYHLMRNLGNKITQHSPTRGYSMELGSGITVLLASRLALPVSTTQCITGSFETNVRSYHLQLLTSS